MSYIYKLKCDDTNRLIICETKLNLGQVVRNAVISMSDGDFSGKEDWFELLTDIVCLITDSKRVEIEDEIYTEDAYFEELNERQQKETGCESYYEENH